MKNHISVKKNELVIPTTTYKHAMDIISEQKKPETKECLWYDFIYMKFNTRQNSSISHNCN